MDRRAFGLAAVASLAVAGCSSRSTPAVRPYHGPEVTSIVVQKGLRRMYLMNDSKVLRKYRVGLGFAPRGHKTVEGDGRTPEGAYWIDRRNPNSSFFLSIGISYPNARDIAKARAMGKSPGGDIFIHGEPNRRKDRDRAARLDDWTAGCISVKNKEMAEIYAMVNTGIPIFINA
ncbi:L,D-transpeptidase family protein [Epibacterium ulvae]|uniref:L,D-transpeptidase catalytic domain n=1 Tax=Epibacterium ulvae TaxID=1156985 RepID=A0A1G5RDZ2_9RHOB|nr:L,D-transpeptidase family protein [Epibacterium ulvae]SCZ72285.1 L,D-transpeptidase catalytic domain [Epibacterium ulvae]